MNLAWEFNRELSTRAAVGSRARALTAMPQVKAPRMPIYRAAQAPAPAPVT
jgi:hypothetical protein